jgi:hypothetical protein
MNGLVRATVGDGRWAGVSGGHLYIAPSKSDGRILIYTDFSVKIVSNFCSPQT